MYHGERLNGGTHLVGTLLAAAGAAVLVARQGDPWKIAPPRAARDGKQ